MHKPWPIRWWANCSLHAERICIGVVWCVLCAVCCDPSKRFTVSPVVYPRVFKILTALTFGALRKNHNVSPTFEDIQKKTHWTEKRKPVIHVRSAMYHESSRTQPKFGTGRCVGKKRSDVHDGSTKKRYLYSSTHYPAEKFMSITVSLNAKKQ